MNETEIVEIAQKVKRFSHRIKNANNPTLHKEALKAVNRILRERNAEKARDLEDEFIKKLQRVYKVETPDGISFQSPVMNMSEYTDSNPQDLNNVAAMATTVAQDYADRDVDYAHVDKDHPYPADNDASSKDGEFSDCSHFVNDVLNKAGFDIPYTSTAQLPGSPNFTQLVPPEAPQPGDIILQGSHMGIFQKMDDNGNPVGTQMGVHGPKDLPWGGTTAYFGKAPISYYRPKK